MPATASPHSSKLLDGLLVVHFLGLLQRINIANEFNPQAVFPAPLSSAQLSEFATNLHSRHVRQCKL